MPKGIRTSTNITTQKLTNTLNTLKPKSNEKPRRENFSLLTKRQQANTNPSLEEI
jgi:hypothetical protein